MAANDIGPRIGIDGEKEFRDSINAINAQMKALGAEMKAVTAEFAANANSEEALSAKNEVLGKSVQTAKEKLAVLGSQLERQRSKLAELGAELDRVIASEGETSAAAGKAQNAYNQQAKSVANLESQYQTARKEAAEFQNAMDGVEDSSTKAQKALSAQDVLAGMGAWSALEGAVRSATAAIGESIQVGMEFDSAMADIAATMGVTVDSLSGLRDFAQDMGAATAFTATEAAQALNYMALAGYDAEEAMAALPNVLNLAAAGGMDLATASDMVTDAQTALGLSMEESAQLVDEMAQASTKTNTSVAQLGEAILTVGGTAKYLSGGTREINQVLGVLADNSIKGAEGGTKLRNIILSLSSPTEKAAKQLEDLGVAVFDAEGNMREFSDIFPEMQKSLSQLTSQQQIEALGEIFNSRDIAAAQALLGTTVERWDELAVAIDNAAGSAEQMAETRLDNLAGDITLLQSAADGAKIAFSDSLTPALRDAAQAGTGILTFAGEAITEFPILGNVVAGAVTGVGALTVGMGAMAAASTLGVTSIGALTTAILTSPVAPFALAIGSATTALSAFSYAADHAEDKITSTAQAVQQSAAAWEEQKNAVKTQNADIESLAAQLEDLASLENRTAGEKERLLAVTNALNEAVPGLGLSYDTLNDSLNMTTEQILDLARAQAEMEERQTLAASIVEAENLAAQAAREREQAERDLAAAISARDDAVNAGMAADIGMIEEMDQLNSEVKNAEAVLKELKQAEIDSAAQAGEMKAQLEALAEGAEETADGLGETTAAAGDMGTGVEEAAASLEELEEATLYAAGAADTMAAALKEQEKDGSLSLETTNKLIEAGYAAAIAIDQETGAVTLDQGAYVALANAKIQEQMATLEAQKASIQAANALAQEEAAARADSSAYWDAAKAKAALANADDLQALELQIAALNRAQASLTSYGAATTTVARRSSGASKTVKTQAQKDLEEYKALKAALDHEKAMDLVDEADYYSQLAGLRDKYLTDAANLSDYNKVTETIYKADQIALANREKLWQSASDNILKLEEDFQKQLSSRAQEIVNSYKLFEAVPEQQKVAGEELIANLEGQISSIESFYDNLDALAGREVSGDLVAEIRSMGVSAAGELEGLLSLTDEELSRYSELYGEKQELANRIAMKELEDLRAATSDEILSQLDDVAELYNTNAPALGLAFANSLAEGMFQGMPAVEDMAQTVANAAMSAFQRSYNGDVEAMMTSPRQSVTSEDIGELLAGAVNGINMSGGGGTAQPINITIQTRDGIEIARAFLPDIRTAEKETPQTLDDM